MSNTANTIGAKWLGSLAVVGLLFTHTVLSETAQPMRFKRLSLDEGLSQSAVMSITQDQAGFMWFGTENGLNRYDGYDFRQFKRQSTPEGALKNDFILSTATDLDGNLWIATDGGGLAKRAPGDDAFQIFRHDASDPRTLASDTLQKLHVDESGTLWIGTRGAGLDRLDRGSSTFLHYRHQDNEGASLSSDSISAIYADRSKNLWVGTDKGLNRLDLVTGDVIRFQHDPADPRSLSDNRVLNIFQDRQGSLWVGTASGGLNRFEGANAGFTHFTHDPANPASLSNNQVEAILEDTGGRLWLGTADGLNLMDRRSGQFARFFNDPADPESLSDSYIISLFQDRGGMLWVGTKMAGLSNWNPRSWRMGHHEVRADDTGAIANVTAFAEDRDGKLWIGTFGAGLNVMDRSSGTASRFAGNADGSISDERVMALLADHQGMLWVGTMGGGLNRVDTVTGQVKTYRRDSADATSLSSNGIMSLFEDRRGNIWVGTFGGGLSRLDPNTETFQRFLHDPSNSSSLSSPRATAVAQDHTGAIWVGTDGGGLNVLTAEDAGFRPYRHDPADAGSLSSDTVYALHVDAKGVLWVGTRAGLNRVAAVAADRIVFEHVSQADGLANDVIYGVRSDTNGDLWLSTNHGISRYNPDTGEIKNFHRSHGLQAEEFNFGAHYRNRAGELFFGGASGFNAFYPEQLDVDSTPPPIVLTALEKFNEPAETTVPFSALSELKLGYADDVVSFQFAALDYAAPEQNRYAFMLEGFDKEWMELGNRRLVTYTNLDKGDYVLRVKAANSDSVWNDAGPAITVSVAPAPWETWWAYTLYCLAGALVIAGVWAAQQRKLAKEAEYSGRLEQEVRERTQDIADRNLELEDLNERLQQASLTDPLTGLRNRRFLFEEAPKDIQMVRRAHDRREEEGENADDLVFVMVDLDHFKPVNDSCGHDAGDKMLLQVKDALLQACRASDVVIRWGGDEFLVIGRQTKAGDAETLAERIRSRIAQQVFALGDGQVARTTASIGYACYPFVHAQPDALSWEQVLSLADAAMYRAKESRNAWVGFSATDFSENAEDLYQTAKQNADELVARGELEIKASLSSTDETAITRRLHSVS
jgi:diguanylate cyclase (GGDEF)-like protein